MLCLLGCVVLSSLWVRSCYVFDVIARGYAGGNYYEYSTLPAQFRLTIAYSWPYDRPRMRASGPNPPYRMKVFGQHAVYERWYPFGIAIHYDFRKVGIPSTSPGTKGLSGSAVVYYHTIAVPFATMLLLMVAYPGWWSFTGRRRRNREAHRVSHGLCPGCGYDMRGSDEMCPECGRRREDRRTTGVHTPGIHTTLKNDAPL